MKRNPQTNNIEQTALLAILGSLSFIVSSLGTASIQANRVQQEVPIEPVYAQVQE